MNKKSKKPRPSTKAQHTQGGGGFVDRSGKVHGRKVGHGPSGGTSAPPIKPHGKILKNKPNQNFTPKPDRGGERKPDRNQDRRPDRRQGGKTDRKRDRDSEKRPAKDRILKAIVDKNSRGFGFLIFEDRKVEDSFVNPRDAERLFHGDRVEVEFDHRGHIVEVKVLAHRFREVVGRYLPHPSGKEGKIVYERKRAREEIQLSKSPGKLQSGDWIKAKLTFHDRGPFNVTGEVTEVYGKILPASADIGMVAAEFNLVEEHPEAAEREAKAFKLDVDKWRTDLKSVPFITIDGETARDFDDAIYVERDKDGYILWVAIADVSHYVTPGSALDEDARSRGTSVYFPERAFHMLPRALSENLCSIKPNEPRLAMVAKLFFDRHGKLLNTEVIEAVMESKRRATYTEIAAEWEKNKTNKSWEYAHHFALYHLLRKMRSDRGSIDFDLPEANVIVDKDGEPTDILLRERNDAHRLIEEFMIVANEAVTEWIMKRGWPFIFRVHDEPATKSIDTFSKLAATMGVLFKSSKKSSLNVALAEFIKTIDGHPAQALLNMQLLRSMKQAVYTAEHGIHFGLASKGYTHFTSPIRRYPDLVVHRMLRLALRNKQNSDKKLQKTLEEVAEHCSYRERVAAEADREATKLKQVRIMIPKMGEDFPGKIVGMVESGMFVQVDHPYVEGMVSQESMTTDFFQFNPEKMVFLGKRTRQAFKIGDPVKVKCANVDLDRRRIDFVLVT